MKNVAFDFDGVIHTQVTPPDKYGQRHPVNGMNSIPNKPFYKIIELIKTYHKYNYNIYIITSRKITSLQIVKKTLHNFNLHNIIKDNNIYFTGDTHKGDKVDILDKLKINCFYDDSICHFKKILENKHKLIYLNKLYMTVPENNEIFEIKK